MAPIPLRAAGYQGEASVHTRALRVLAERLAGEGFAPGVAPDVTGQGRPATDLFAMTEGGEIELCYFASSYLAERVPALGLLDLPFRSPSRAALDGALGERLRGEVAARTGFAVAGFWNNGARHLTNRFRPIRTPADCAGLSIRTMRSDLHQRTFAAMGFVPRYIDVKDYPGAVREGRVDAQENPLTNAVNFGVHATHPHLTLTGHFQGVTLVLAHAGWLAALPAPARAAFDAAMAEATAAQARFAAAEDARCLTLLREAGVAVLGQGAFDRAAFARATAPVAQAALDALDPALAAHLPPPLSSPS